MQRWTQLIRISIHALREEGDRCTCPEAVAAYEFLSTPSARRATSARPTESHDQRISIHALREEGDPLLCKVLCGRIISIHALREEGDAG